MCWCRAKRATKSVELVSEVALTQPRFCVTLKIKTNVIESCFKLISQRGWINKLSVGEFFDKSIDSSNNLIEFNSIRSKISVCGSTS